MTDEEARKIAEQYAAEIRYLMDQGVPKHQPFDKWLADWFMTFRAATVALLLLAFTGCVHVYSEPGLPMPERPQVKFFRQSGNVCLSEPDANLLLKYSQKLNEFEKTRNELLK